MNPNSRPPLSPDVKSIFKKVNGKLRHAYYVCVFCGSQECIGDRCKREFEDHWMWILEMDHADGESFCPAHEKTLRLRGEWTPACEEYQARCQEKEERKNWSPSFK